MNFHALLKGTAFGLIGLLGLLGAAAAFLWVLFSPSRDVVAEVTSPSGSYVATVVEINGGATTSFGYDVYVARAGWMPGSRQVASLYGATRSPRAYGVNLRWPTDNELHIEYFTARAAEEIGAPVVGLAPNVDVILVPGVGDPTAPPGGMLYNLSGTHAAGG